MDGGYLSRNLDELFRAPSTPHINTTTPGNIGTNTIHMPGTNNNGGMVLQVTNQVQSRTIQTVTLSNMNTRMFEQIATFAKPGQTLDSYCDADAIHQIHVNLQVMKLQDPAFTVDKTSDIKDIINAMLKFYHKGHT